MSSSTVNRGYAPSREISHGTRRFECWLQLTRAVHADTPNDVGAATVDMPIYQVNTFILGYKQYAAEAEGAALDEFKYTRYGEPS